MLITGKQVQASIRAPASSIVSSRAVHDAIRLRIVKAGEERRFVLGKAYGPGELDGHKEFMTPETIENAAWGFMHDGGRQIGLHHMDGTVGHATVVESYIWRADPWEIVDVQGNSQIIRAGTWLVGAVFDEPAWRLVKSGRVTGWSIDGLGSRVEMPRDQAPLA